MNFNIKRGVLQSCILHGAAVCCKLNSFMGEKQPNLSIKAAYQKSPKIRVTAAKSKENFFTLR